MALSSATVTSPCGTGSGCRKPSPRTLFLAAGGSRTRLSYGEAMAESITSDTLTLVEVMLAKMDYPRFPACGDAGAGGTKQPRRLVASSFSNHQRPPGQQQPGREHPVHSGGSGCRIRDHHGGHKQAQPAVAGDDQHHAGDQRRRR